MKERPSTVVDAMFASNANFLQAATKVVGGPAAELWNRMSQTREVAKRQLLAMVRLRASKRRSPGRLRFA